MSDMTRELPKAESGDPDGVQVALRAAHKLWSYGDTSESLRWLKRAAETASDEGADRRSLQLAKAAAELRAYLMGQRRAESSPVAGGQFSIPAAKQTSLASPPAPSPAMAVRQGRAPSAPYSQPSRSLGVSSPGSPPPPADPVYAEISSFAGGAEASRSAWGSEPPSAPPPLPAPNGSSGEDDELEAEALPDDASDDEMVNATEPPLSAVQRWLGATADEPWAAEAVSQAAEALQPTPDPSEVSARSVPPPLPPRTAGEAADPATPPPASSRIASARSAGAGDLDDEPAEEVDEDPLREERPQESLRQPDSEPEVATSPSAPTGEAKSPSTGRPVGAGTSADGFSPPPSGMARSLGSSPAGAAGSSVRFTARVHHQAVRVAVAVDPQQEGRFFMRPLREGEACEASERVALLVALEPGSALV